MKCSNSSFSEWYSGYRFGSMRGSSVLMREIYFDYIHWCKSSGIKFKDICSDREFSRLMSSMGHVIVHSRRGASFIIN